MDKMREFIIAAGKNLGNADGIPATQCLNVVMDEVKQKVYLHYY